jgi:hypothetical protein
VSLAKELRRARDQISWTLGNQSTFMFYSDENLKMHNILSVAVSYYLEVRNPQTNRASGFEPFFFSILILKLLSK